MLIKKDSLLLRIIFYNDIAIVVIATVLAFVFSIMVFDGMEKRLLDNAREKNSILNKAYISEIKTSKDDLFNATTTVFNFSDININGNNQYLVANAIKEHLVSYDRSKYKESHVSIISYDGRILGEAYTDKKLRNDILTIEKLSPEVKYLESKDYYLIASDSQIYIKIIQAVRGYNQKSRKYVVLTIPITSYSKENIREFVELYKDEGFFFLVGDKFLFGDFRNLNFKTSSVEDVAKNFNRKNIVKKSVFNYNLSFAKTTIDNVEYLITFKSIQNPKGKTIGYMGVTVSKANFNATKYMVGTIIVAIVLIAIIISTTLCSRFFTKLLSPISKIAENADNFGIDEYKFDVEEKGTYEIRKLINSITNMGNRIIKNDELLKKKNESLKQNLDRIVAIEKILMYLDVENDFNEGIEGLLKALTSEVGLGYSRAIFFEYNPEKLELHAKKISINKLVSNNIEKYTGGVNGFKFQIKDMESLLPLLKVKYEKTNLFWEAVHNLKVIYHNDKGYKYNFGNDMFKAIGINNFMIIPIADKDINKGCLLIDYFGKDLLISEEEVEVMNLLLLNLMIRVKNKELEEEKIMKERIQTINKISEKFINNQKEILPQLKEFVEKIKNNIYNNESGEEWLSIIENKILELEIENRNLEEIIKNSNINFRAIDISKIIERVVEDFRPKMLKYSIDTSVLVNTDTIILGDEQKLYQMFYEIIKNAMESILVRNKLDKKINIMVLKDGEDRVIAEIVDNGIGMTEEEVRSLRFSYSGSMEGSILGFGLATVYKIVREHNGVIKISSLLDEGTRLKIIFNSYKEEI